MAEEEHASMGQVKAIIRRKLRKHEVEEHHGLNIYPMMDMMTILLVFMVMQFANSAAAVVTESDELKIPYSISRERVEDATPLQIGKSSVVVDGQHVFDLRNGQIDPSLKRGGRGFIVNPLQRKLERVWENKRRLAAQMGKPEPSTEIQLIVDEETRYDTLMAVVQTSGVVGFDQVRFLVDKSE